MYACMYVCISLPEKDPLRFKTSEGPPLYVGREGESARARSVREMIERDARERGDREGDERERD